MNQPLRAPIAPKSAPPQATQTAAEVPIKMVNGQKLPQFPKQPKPNDPFRDAMKHFVGKKVIVTSHEGRCEGTLVCFDFASKALVVKLPEEGRILLSSYHSIRMAPVLTEVTPEAEQRG